MNKYSTIRMNYLEKRGIPLLLALGLGALAVGGTSYLWGSHGRQAEIDKLNADKNRLKEEASKSTGLNLWPGIGAVGGAALGYSFGDDWFPHLNPQTAKFVGGLGGGLVGTIGGTLLKEYGKDSL